MCHHNLADACDGKRTKEEDMTNSNSRSRTVRRARGHVASTLFVLLALASLVCASALTACAGSSSDSSSSASKSASGSSSKKTLVVAMELAYPPFETKTDSGEPDGVSVQFIKDFGLETVKGNRSVLKFDSGKKSGELYIVVASRFVVTVKGRQVAREDLLAYGEAMDYRVLEEN